MNMFSLFRKETRAAETEEYTPQSLDDIVASSDTVSADDVMNIPAVDSSIEFISGLIATMPIKLFQKLDNGVSIEVKDDRRIYLLNVDTGDLLDPSQMKKAFVKDYLLLGAGYIFINRKGNNVESLHYVKNNLVTVQLGNDNIFKTADIRVDNKRYNDYQLLRATRKTVDGIKGIGLLDEHNLLLSSMFNAIKYENKNLGSGCKKGFLKSAARLENKVMGQLRAAWRKLNSSDNSDVMILNQGLEFESAGTTAVENQLTDNKKINASAIYSIFGLNDNLFEASNVGYDAYRDSIRTGVAPIIHAIEIAMNKTLLLEKEKAEYFFKFDLDSVMQADTTERFKNYEVALKNSWLTVDDVRIRENLEPIGFDRLKIGLDSVLFNASNGDIYVANTGIVGNINKNNENQNEQTKGGE